MAKRKPKTKVAQTPPTLNARGNPIAQAAIMRKGGVHQKSKSAERQKQKRKMRKDSKHYMATRKKGGHDFFQLSNIMFAA